MSTYELYKDVEETQKRLERQVETILQFEKDEETNDEASLQKGEESIN